MKINRRIGVNPYITAQLFLIPFWTYIVMKIIGVKMHSEWFWWAIIPLLVIIWVFVNFKFKKK